MDAGRDAYDGCDALDSNGGADGAWGGAKVGVPGVDTARDGCCKLSSPKPGEDTSEVLVELNS